MRIINSGNTSIAVVETDTVIKNAEKLLDIMVSVVYNSECDNSGIVINKQSLPEEFFDLKTGIAGEMLQKASNYRMKIAIVGGFNNLDSTSLKDFIRECNRGNQIYFTDSIQSAVNRLSSK